MTRVLPFASVTVKTLPYVASVRTRVLPDASVVVTSGRSLDEAPDEAGTRTWVMMEPLLPTLTLATAEAVVIVEPWEFVVVTATAGKVAEVVMVFPRELVVVKTCSTLVEAEACRAEVCEVTVLPCEFVVVRRTGTRTPPTPEEPMLEGPWDRVGAVMADDTLVMVLPAALVVVRVDAPEAAMAEETVTDDSMVLPREFVVVTAMTVGTMEVSSAEEEGAVVEPEDAAVEPTSDEPDACEETALDDNESDAAEDKEAEAADDNVDAPEDTAFELCPAEDRAEEGDSDDEAAALV